MQKGKKRKPNKNVGTNRVEATTSTVQAYEGLRRRFACIAVFILLTLHTCLHPPLRCLVCLAHLDRTSNVSARSILGILGVLIGYNPQTTKETEVTNGAEMTAVRKSSSLSQSAM